MKTCTKCGVEKEVSEYFKNKKSRDGLLASCKNCCSQWQREYNRGRPKKEKRITRDGFRFCPRCNQERIIENFYKSKTGKMGGYCKPCLKLYFVSRYVKKRKIALDENPQATDTTTIRGEERKTVVGFGGNDAKQVAFKDICDEIKSEVKVTTRKMNRWFAPSQFYQKTIYDNYTVHANYICLRLDRVKYLFLDCETLFIP